MPTKVLYNPGTPVVWSTTSGNDLTLTSLAAGAGVQGEMIDISAAGGFSGGLMPRWWSWLLTLQFGETPVVDEAVEVWWKYGNGVISANDDGDAAGSVSASDKLKNLLFLGAVTVDEAATAVPMAVGDDFRIKFPFGAPVIFNQTADALSATASVFSFTIVPQPDEIQN